MRVSRRNLLKGLAVAGAATATGRKARARKARVASDDDHALLYDATLCVGCRACVTACKQANDLPPDRTEIDGAVYDAPRDLNGTTKTVIKLHEDGAERSFYKAGCMHCVDPACVSACMLGALHVDVGGIVVYDRGTCLGCRYCQIACPFNVPKFEWNSATPEIVKCELCRHRLAEGRLPACAESCPRNAVIYGGRGGLLAEAHRRLAEAPERYAGKVYGEFDGGGTHVLVLSAVPFDRLGLPELGPEPVPHTAETVQHGVYKGFIAPAALYAAFGVAIWRNQRREKTEAHAAEERTGER